MSGLIFTANIKEPMKLENFLRRNMQVSRRLLAKCKYQGDILRNGEHIRTVDSVRPGDEIILISPDKDGKAEANSSLKVPVLYRGEHLIAYDKPPFMPCHQSFRHRMDTLANAFAAEEDFKSLPFRCITRLDRNTSGICLVALSAYGAGFVQGKIKKSYMAAVIGELKEGGIIDMPIGRKDDSFMLREVRNDGKRAFTRYEPVFSNGKYTLVRLYPETGRTHQLRIHMAYIGYPLAGDELYGTEECSDIKRHSLHCCEIEFEEPESGNIIKISSELPEDIEVLFK